MQLSGRKNIRKRKNMELRDEVTFYKMSLGLVFGRQCGPKSGIASSAMDFFFQRSWVEVNEGMNKSKKRDMGRRVEIIQKGRH